MGKFVYSEKEVKSEIKKLKSKSLDELLVMENRKLVAKGSVKEEAVNRLIDKKSGTAEKADQIITDGGSQ